MKKRLRNLLGICVVMVLVLLSSRGISPCAEKGAGFIRASGKVAFGPFEFLAPQGYWYYPRTFPKDGLQKGEEFLVTFYQTKDDIPPKKPLSAQQQPKNVLISFMVFPNEFKDVESYYRALADILRLNNLSSNDIVHKDLARPIRDLFRDVHGWSCREQVIKGYGSIFSIDCVALAEYGIVMSASGFDESKVLDKAPLLKEIMSSITSKISLRNEKQGR